VLILVLYFWLVLVSANGGRGYGLANDILLGGYACLAGSVESVYLGRQANLILVSYLSFLLLSWRVSYLSLEILAG